MAISRINSETKDTGCPRPSKYIRKLIALLFMAFPTLNIMLIATKLQNRNDFHIFLQSKYVWALFLFIFLTAFSIFLLLLRKLLANIAERKAICYAVIAIAVSVPRLLVISLFTVFPKDDFKFYHTLASALAEGHVAGSNYISLFPHTFGYPAVLSLIYRIFGPFRYMEH